MDVANSKKRNLNVVGLDAVDLRTRKPCGDFWDFSKAQDRKQALDYILKHKPTWVIGSPPCTAFSQINVGLNFPKLPEEKVQAMIKAGTMHLRFMISLYRVQLGAGRHFLHEHPQTARSWEDPWMQQLLQQPRVRTTISDQCEYGLTAVAPDGTVLPAKTAHSLGYFVSADGQPIVKEMYRDTCTSTSHGGSGCSGSLLPD